VLGWSAALVIAGARQAGEVVGAQAGFSAAALFDPEAGDDLTPIGHLYGLVALGVFLALDGPLAVVRALAESYLVVPAGLGTFGGDGPGPDGFARFAFGRVGAALGLSVRAAAPVALALTMAGVALGLIGRAAPTLQRAALALPVRAALGLALVLLGLGALAAALGAAWGGWPGPVFDLLHTPPG
jgi:flagellar biosynthesis protein FliR